MATGSSRDAKLTLRVEALGEENIKKVEQGLRELAEQGGASAAEFQQLADEIAKLGDQNAALQAFTALAAGAEDLRTKQEAAATTAQEMAARLDLLRQSTDAARAAQQQATQALNDGRVRYAEAGNAIRELKAEYDAAGRESEEYRTSLLALVREQGEARVATVGLRQAQLEANAEVSEAAAAQNKLETAYTAAEKRAAAAAAASEANALAMRETAAAAERLGVDTADLAAAESGLVAALLQGAQAVNSRRAALVEMAEADRLAAIEAKTLEEMTRSGAIALQAEEAAIRDAARAVREYELAKEKATADAAAWQKEADAIVDAAEAAQRLQKENLALATAAVEAAAAQKRFNDELGQQKAREQADYVRALEQAFDALEAQERAVVAETQRVNDAFRKIDTRALEDVEKEIEQVRAAMAAVADSGRATGAALDTAFTRGEARIKALEREARELTGTLTLADRASNLLKNSMGQIAAGNIIADGIGFLVEKVKDLAREFLATTVETEQLRKALAAIYKDSTLAGRQFDYLKAASNAAGISVGAMSQSFVQFSASATAANIPIQVSNDLFMSVARTAGTLGLTADATSGALNALGQMAAKGCHAPGTLIATYFGHSVPVESVSVGDLLQGPDGRPRVVLKLAHGTQEMFRVIPSYGEPFEVNLDHKLRLDFADKAATVTVRQYVAMPNALKEVARLRHKSVEDVSFTVESVGEGEFYGFLISDDHLYLDAQGFEHHNTVSLEELRQQLGDRMPGALSAAAKGLGLTEAQLIKLVESGSLAARDFFPAFSEGLKEMHGATEGIIPLWNRFKNLLTETAQGVGDAGGLRIMTVSLRALVGVLGLLLVPLAALVQAFGAFASAIGIVVGAIATFTNPFDSLKKVVVEGWASIANLTGGFFNLATGMEVSGAAAQKNAADIKVGADAATAAAAANDGLTRSQQAQKVAAEIAGQAQGDLSSKLVQTNAAIDILLGAQTKETEALAKNAKATKEYGDTLVSLAQLGGNQGQILAATTAAAESYAAASAKVAASQREELALLEQKLARLIATRTAQGDSADAIAKETAELEKKVVASRAEVEQTNASAEAARAATVARRLAAEVAEDNSKKTAEYAIQLARANETLAITAQLEKVGAVSKTELEAATEAASVAQARYVDSLKDAAASSQLELETRKAGILIAKESVSAEVALLQAKAEQARNSGLVVTAIDLERTAKTKQLEVDRLLIDIKEVELQLMRAELEAKLELIKLQEPENALKIKELELRIKLTEVQEKQIESSRELLKIKSDELTRSEMLSTNIGKETEARTRATSATQAQTDAMDKIEMRYKNSADYTERQIALLEREAAAAERAAEAKRKYWNVDKDGFTLDNNGQRMQQSVPTERYVYDTAKGQGLTEQQALALVDQYMRNGKVSGMGQQGLGASKDWFTVVNEAVNKQVLSNARTAANTPANTSNNTTGTNTNTNKTVTINVGGKSQTIGVNSDSDVNKLTSILRELESAAGTSA